MCNIVIPLQINKIVPGKCIRDFTKDGRMILKWILKKYLIPLAPWPPSGSISRRLIHSYFSPASKINFLQIILNFAHHLFLGFPTELYPSGVFLNIFFTVLSY
jgi:hypothetical protein